MIPSIAARQQDIATLCRRFHVRRRDLFGSAARGADFAPGRSDIDVIVDYAPPHTPALADFFALREALTALPGCPIDLVIASTLRHPFLRAAIERLCEMLYAT